MTSSKLTTWLKTWIQLYRRNTYWKVWWILHWAKSKILWVHIGWKYSLDDSSLSYFQRRTLCSVLIRYHIFSLVKFLHSFIIFQREHLKIAQQYFQLVGGSASECGMSVLGIYPHFCCVSDNLWTHIRYTNVLPIPISYQLYLRKKEIAVMTTKISTIHLTFWMSLSKSL